MLKTMCDIDKHIAEISKLNQEIGRLKGKIEIAETSINKVLFVIDEPAIEWILKEILNDLKS